MFEGQTVMITGAAGALGRATAPLFAGRGVYRFVEVKGPGDQLRREQRLWFEFFRRGRFNLCDGRRLSRRQFYRCGRGGCWLLDLGWLLCHFPPIESLEQFGQESRLLMIGLRLCRR